ncbi:MAG: type II secretion system protein [Opitutales bacterium]
MSLHCWSLSRRGFTLVEIMIAVSVIGLLAAIAIPAFQKTRAKSQAYRLANDFRTYANAFEIYALEFGYWPDDEARGVMPDGMDDYMRTHGWTESTPVGGNWDWDFDVKGVYAGISITKPTAGDDPFVIMDEVLDDGDLSSGEFIKNDDRFTYVLEPY